MALADRLTEMLDSLPRDWSSARVTVQTEDPSEADRAATVLAPAGPGRSGSTFRFDIARGSQVSGTSPRLVGRVLSRLDADGISARLALVAHDEDVPENPPPEPHGASVPATAPPGLAAQWDGLATKLPPDWSDLLCEVRLDSTDHVETGALRLGPVNPYLVDDHSTFQFRVAHRFGYGAAPEMTRRCLERLDEAGIAGRFRVLRVLSDTRPVHTQGPVWRIGGRAV